MNNISNIPQGYDDDGSLDLPLSSRQKKNTKTKEKQYTPYQPKSQDDYDRLWDYVD